MKWLRSSALFLVAFVLAVASGCAPAAARTVQEAQQTDLTILGNRTLTAAGDTATWCAVSSFDDGTFKLGETALKVAALSTEKVIAVRVTADVLHRCAPLLKAKGLPTTMSLMPIEWSTTRTEPPNTRRPFSTT